MDTDNDTAVSLEEAVAERTSRLPAIAPSEQPEEDSGAGGKRYAPGGALSLKDAADARSQRLQREDAERASYERAAKLDERALPSDLNASDAELQRSELAALRATMQEVQANQANAGMRMRAEEQAVAHIQATNQAHAQASQVANAYNDNVAAVLEQELRSIVEVLGNGAELQQAYSTDPFFRERVDASRARVALAQAEQQAALKNYAMTHENLGALHDRAFLDANPDMDDPELRAHAARGAVEMLREVGYTSEEIQAGWSMGVGPLSAIRDNRQQSALLELWW